MRPSAPLRPARYSLGLVALLLAAACDGPAPTTDEAATAAPSAPSVAAASASVSASAAPTPALPKKNVLLITIDSMRADMPWQGYSAEIAPNLTKLAAESTVYTRAYAISSFTSKSVGALLSGRFPSTLYRGCSFFTEYSSANVFFPELLQSAGVETLAGHAHLYFDKSKNLRQGFDAWRLVDGLTWNAETDESVTSQKMTPLAQELLSPDNTKGPFFGWFHYMDPHDKYVRHEESPDFGHRARQLYDNEIFYTDLWVGKLLDWARTQPWWKDTVLIVSADHGEAFGEHDMWKHAFALWEVLTHVPLIVHVPGQPGRKVDARRSHLDLAPTILDLLGVAVPSDFVGKSMRPELLEGAAPDDREPILLDLPADSYNPPTRVTIKGDYKLIEDPGEKYKLYNLTEDPDERLEISGRKKNADAFADMKATHAAAWKAYPRQLPYGDCKLIGGGKATGPKGPEGWVDPAEKAEPKDDAKKD